MADAQRNEAVAAAAESCVYGPVPSRRLGRSLGVDLVPLKTCTFDCVYCQLGPTTDKTVRRRRWVEPEDVVARVAARLGSEPDVIALAGSGEPTLYDGVGDVIAGIKELTTTPVVVITNGALLGLPDVQHDLSAADIVMPSLDATDEALFQRINRPAAGLRFRDVVEGMVDFRRRFAGRIWLEVMLVDGLTGVPDVVPRIAAIAARIRPDRIQLNTAVRPPAEPSIRPVALERLASFANAFTPAAEVIVGDAPSAAGLTASSRDVLALLSRRPCTTADIAAGLGIHHSEALKLVTSLLGSGDATTSLHDGRRFYAAAAPPAHSPTKEWT